MAATERGALLAAALALPGIHAGPAKAESAPDTGLIAIKVLDYRDWQPGADRMRITAPSLYALVPLSERFALEGTLQYDSVSGASPLYFNTLSGASGLGVRDRRKSGDLRLSTYLGDAVVGFGAAYSHEDDYASRAASVDVRISSEDRNRTWAFGFGGSADRIDSENGVAVGEQRHVLDFLFGVTQVLSATAIVQSNLTWSRGHGYYSDPYKPLDTRPDHRRVFAWLTRLNLHFPDPDATLRLGYRYGRDSFGVVSSTVEAVWAQPLPAGWSVSPTVRYYTQSAADFYFDPPFPQGFRPGEPYTADTRLSAFGAFTAGVKVGKALPDGWSADVEVAFYRQRAEWRLGGDGSPGIEPFSARWLQVGLAKTF